MGNEKLKIKNWVFGLFCFAIFACTEPPTPSLRQTDRELIDSLYSMHYDSVAPILDSQCIVLQAEIIEQATDSILKQRLVEKAKLKARYQKELKIEN